VKSVFVDLGLFQLQWYLFVNDFAGVGILDLVDLDYPPLIQLKV
jgi:hypothetical protein